MLKLFLGRQPLVVVGPQILVQAFQLFSAGQHIRFELFDFLDPQGTILLKIRQLAEQRMLDPRGVLGRIELYAEHHRRHGDASEGHLDLLPWADRVPGVQFRFGKRRAEPQDLQPQHAGLGQFVPQEHRRPGGWMIHIEADRIDGERPAKRHELRHPPAEISRPQLRK